MVAVQALGEVVETAPLESVLGGKQEYDFKVPGMQNPL